MNKKTKEIEETTEDTLKLQYQKFGENIANGMQPKEAYMDAYPNASEATARTNSCVLLKNTNIQKFIKKRRLEISKVTELDTIEVIKGVSELASVSVLDLLDQDGTFDLNAIRDAGLGRFVKSVTITERFLKNGDRVISTKLDGYSRLEAYKEMAEYLGIKQLPRENEQKLKNTIKAIEDYMHEHPEAVLERVVNFFSKGRNVPVETLREHFGVVQEVSEGNN